jgi:hypothetical protein
MKARLLIVTDLGLLKAYRLEPREEGSPRLTLIEQFVLEPAHQRLTQQLTDSAGRRAAPPGNMGGGTMADSHNLLLENRRRLIRQLAQKIETLANSNSSDGFWLAAQKEILHPLVDSLTRGVRDRIEKSLPEDLTKLEPKQMLGHFLRVTE